MDKAAPHRYAPAVRRRLRRWARRLPGWVQRLGATLFAAGLLRQFVGQGFFHLLSASFLVQFLGFGTLLLVPRFVTPADLGQLKLIQDLTALFLLLAGFGFNNAVLKLCSERRPTAERRYFLKAAFLRSLWTTAGTYGVMAALALSGLIVPTGRLGFWLLIYGLSLPFSALTLLLSAYLQARQQIRPMARAQVLAKLQAVPLIVLATWRFGFEGFVVATVVAYALGLWPFLVQVGVAFLRTPPRPLPRLFMRMAGYSTLSNSIHTLGKHADIYILGLFARDAADVGYYALAKIFLMGASLFTATLQRLALPSFSERADDAAWFRRNLVRMQLQTAVLSIGVALAVHAGAWCIIRLAYAPQYLTALRYLDILLVKYVLWSSFAIIGVAFMSLGRPRYNALIAAIGTPISLVLSYVLLQHYGTVGVAWAQVGSHAVTLVLMLVLIRHVLARHHGTGQHL